MWTQKGKGKAGQIGRLGLTYIYITWGFPGGSDSKESSCNAETWVCSLGQEDLLEKEMATHSSILSWRIPWTEEPGGLKSMGLQSRIRLSDYHFFFHIHYCCSVTRSCLTLCVPMDCSTPGFPVLHYLYVH